MGAQIRRLTKAVKYEVNYRVCLKVLKLDGTFLKILGFSDASFANNSEFTSQLGHIVLCPIQLKQLYLQLQTL